LNGFQGSGRPHAPRMQGAPFNSIEWIL